MSTRKKILFIVWSFSYGGGAERVLSYLIRALEATGRYDIDLLEVQHFDIGWEPLPDTVTALEPIIDETAKGLWARARRFARRRLMGRDPFALREKVRGGEKYDVVIAFNYQLPTFFVRPSECSISWNHGSIECLADDPVGYERQRDAYAYFNRIVAIAQRTRDSIVELFPEVAPKCEIIHNGFPVDEIFEKAASSTEISLEPHSLVAVGRLDNNKRPELILEAFRCIAKTDPLPHLYYLGEGAHEVNVRRLASEYGLGDRVHFLGYQTNPYPVIKQAACVISLSESEGFQSVFVEGLLLGVPFISTPAGAAEELSGDGRFGRVISEPHEAVDAFRDMSQLSDEQRAAMVAYASSFSPDHQVAELERVIDEITGECHE